MVVHPAAKQFLVFPQKQTNIAGLRPTWWDNSAIESGFAPMPAYWRA